MSLLSRHEHIRMEPPAKTPTRLKKHPLELLPRLTCREHILPVVALARNILEGPC